MNMLRRLITAFLAVLMAVGIAFGNDAVPAKNYKLEFVIKEVEGSKILNSRSYSMLISGADRSNIRAVSKVPWANKQGASTEVQQISVGVSIDVRGLKEIDGRLSFIAGVDVSAVAGDGTVQSTPIIRQNTWSSTVVVAFRKPTIVFTSDNMDSKRQMQVEITAIPLP
jgi:hypothetical protein